MTRSLDIHLHDDTASLPPEALTYLTTHLARAAACLGLAGELRIRVVHDPEMSRLHAEYLGVDGTTDVITFDLTDPDTPRPAKPTPRDICSDNSRASYGIDSDIWVCVDEGRRQAAAGGYPVERELLLYVVHGVLHCLGWDDHDEAEAAAMHAMEDAVLAAIGAGPVVHR